MTENNLGICIINKSGKILLANNAMKNLFGEDVQKKQCWEVRMSQEGRCSYCPILKEEFHEKNETYESVEIIDGKSFKIEHSVVIQNNEKVILEIFQEIVQKESNSEDIDKEEKRLAQFFDNMLDAYFQADLHGNLVFVNKAALSIYGYESKNELIGKPVANLYANPHDREMILKELSKTNYINDWIGEGKRKDGSTFNISVQFQNVYNDKGIKIGTQGLSKDIQKKIETENIKNELLNRFKLIAKNTPGVIYQYQLNPDGSSSFPYMSSGAKTMLELNPKDTINDATPVFERFHPDDYNRVYQSIMESAKNLSVWEGSFRLKLPSGKVTWIEGRSTPQKQEDGSILWHGYNQDITDRVNRELNLRKFKASVDSAQDAVFWINKTAGFDYVNEQACKILGYTHDELLKLSLYDIAPLAIEDFNRDDLKKLFDDKKSGIYIKENIFQRKDGTKIPVEIKGIFISIEEEGYIYTNARDISERKNNENKLIQHQKLLKDSLRAGKMGTWEFDMISRTFTFQEETGYIFGYGNKEVKLKSEDFEKHIHLGDLDYLLSVHNKTLKEKQFINHEAQIINKEGIFRHIFVLGDVVLDENGEIIGTYGIIQDITEQKERELELLRNRKLLKGSQRAGKIGSWEFNLEDQKLIFEEETYHIFGYDYKEIELDSIDFLSSIVHPEDRDHVTNVRQRIEKEKRFIDHEYRIIRKDAEERHVLIKGDAELNDEGNVIRTYGIIQDITERKVQEKELLIKQKLLIESQRIAKVGSWELNLKTLELKWSEELYRIYGFDDTTRQPIFDDFLNLVHPDDIPIAKRNLNSIFEKKVFEDFECRVVTNSRETKYIFISGEIIFDNKGIPTQLYGIVQDRTGQKLHEEELIRAREKAEESNQLKSAFLLNMSHEIRTPMNGILGFLNLLEQTNLKEQERSEYIATVNKSGERLLNTINDIVEISRIEVGDIKVINKEINLTDLMNFYVNFFKTEASVKNNKLKIARMITDSQAYVKTDKEKLDGILMNLIKNAIKFTTGGTIEIGNYIEMEKIYFFVSDTGKGIPKDKQGVVFDRFVQVETGNARSHEGSGIGLSIVKAYVEALNGNIQVESEVDKGTTFVFSIPYNPAKISPNISDRNENKEVDPTNNTILVAEDDDVNFFLMEQILTPKFKLLQAKSGKEAIRIFRENPSISLILMDIKMPGEYDGLDATRRIRALNKQVPIIAQTAFVNEMYRKEALDAGCNEYLAKPFTPKKLLSVIFKFYQRN